MFRFAWAYQGGGGDTTYLSGTSINIHNASKNIDLVRSAKLDVKHGGINLDVANARKEIDIKHDGFTIDL